ncbi:MAG: hypothetical protein A2741_02195 [Candidatus Zambryskibacteria bacterium RIFCSPHIGHO2_01_FULL_43_27]|nr:MAG: hypothetical protein A2741_02195 [Candidatus Zambryskibacteria bacterium RIFCSPHIGHO2_01_FULL_43_27]
MKNKLIIIAILVIAIIGLATLMFGEYVQAPLTEDQAIIDSAQKPAEEGLKSEVDKGKQGGVISIASPSVALTKEDLWKTWTQYLTFAKDKNIEGVKSLSYQVSESCAKPELKKECEEKMLAVYTAGIAMNEKGFTKAFIDSKQAILKTEVRVEEKDESFVATEGQIVFAVNSSGKMSLLHLDPAQIWTVRKNNASTTAELKARLSLFTKDSDLDGLSDDLERCIFPDDWIVFVCNETNPIKRDSDNDGWWDGVEYFFQN